MKELKQRVYYYDTDQMGVVYHSNYLKWMEAARTEYFRDILPYSEIENMGYFLPVRDLKIKYIDSVRYDEIIKITIELLEISKIKIIFSYNIYDQNENLKATAETTNVFIDHNGNIKKISDELFKQLQQSRKEQK